MKKIKGLIGASLVALAMNATAQTPAKELIDNPLDSIQLEIGQAIDAHDQYTIVGSKFGYHKNGVSYNGAAMLFNNNQFVRYYRTSPIGEDDGLGLPRTMGIGQHAIVMGAPNDNNNNGTVGVAKKTWDGTHYDQNITQYLNAGENGTSFGASVAISDHWIAVGAPNKGQDGGVKMFMRNHGTGVWEDKGWITLPNFSNAPNRFWYSFTNKASFGVSIDITHNNMIVGAPGIGSAYMFRLEGEKWVFAGEHQNSISAGNEVCISDEYAVAMSSNDIFIYKKHWDNTWIPFQTITDLQGAQDVEIDGARIVVGKPHAGPTNGGEVVYYEMRSHQITGTWNWAYDFVAVGKMYVNVASSPNNLIDHRLLGWSVDIQGNNVVAGDPNSRYINFADGAGYRANYWEMIPLNQNSREGIENISIEDLTIFPNPATDQVSVSSGDIAVSAKATDVNGKTIILSTNGSSIDLTPLSAGLYSVEVTTESGVISQKITKQ